MRNRHFFQPKKGGYLFDPDTQKVPPPEHLVRIYHERTKHRPEKYAEGPETLDWENQPNPFRLYQGAPRIPLPLSASDFISSITALFGKPPDPVLLSLQSLGGFIELSLALNAWKSLGPDRWALRCSPSSGNLHPIEAYVISSGIKGLIDGLYHYDPQDHALEHRARLNHEQCHLPSRCLIGLSSIYWREAWKYGERAFRYTHLDLGHVIGSLSAAASTLGWKIRQIPRLDTDALAALLGTNRAEDFKDSEPECPEILMEIITQAEKQGHGQPEPWPLGFFSDWHGQANCLDPRPMYEWPVIDQIQGATAPLGAPPAVRCFKDLGRKKNPRLPPITSGQLIRQRRSAQAFDPKQSLSHSEFRDFLTLLDSVATARGAGAVLAGKIHCVLWIHRVEDIDSGLYLMTSQIEIDPDLKKALDPDFEWTKALHEQGHISLWKLRVLDNPTLAKAIHCHQAIAADAMLLIGCLSDFESATGPSSSNYRGLHWQAGILGHGIYLAAEAMGYRTTGIGCYFDDDYHSLLGLSDARYQALYHLAVGKPLLDHRMEDFTPYPHRISEN